MNDRTTIYTIRHAQTSYSSESRYTGTIDLSISEEGVASLQQAASKLKGIDFDLVVTSPLKRTIETANILVSHQTPIIQSELCIERHFGLFQGKTFKEVQTINLPVLWITVGNDIHSVNQPGSEPFEKVWERAVKFRDWLFEEHTGKNILVVSHAVFLQMFHGLLRGLSCIESLAYFPSMLELSKFDYKEMQLVDEQTISLIQTNQNMHF